jgi:hypothetical protein
MLHKPIESEHFNPPLSAEDRLHDILLPLLKNRGRKHVDLVELGVGGWDLGVSSSLFTLGSSLYRVALPSPYAQLTHSSPYYRCSE